MPAGRTAVVREGLLTLRAQLEDLLAQVGRLHQPRSRSGRS